jgi:gamma-glutamyl-gamma-aminobutyrate hydrolase PuuD
MTETKIVGIPTTGMFGSDKWRAILEAVFAGAWNLDIVSLKAITRGTLPEIDFLLFDGGEDVSSQLYGRLPHSTTHSDSTRDANELFLFKYYYYTPTKYVGICRGHQFINVMMNGLLTQDLPSSGTGHKPLHEAKLVGNTALSKRLGRDNTIVVNSFHHQAVIIPGESLHVTMTGPFGVIEGTESKGDDKFRTVQPHPEYGDDAFPYSMVIMKYLFRIR